MNHNLFRKSFIVVAILFLAAASFTVNGENKGIKNSHLILSEMPHQNVKQNLVENVNTGKDFTGIQDAIDDPGTSSGHTLFVHSGIYHENVTINKSLNLTGENKANTFIVGDGSSNIVTITAEGVTFGGFTIHNCKISRGPLYAGIKINTNNNVVTGNNIQNCYRGVYLQGEITGNVLSHNIITNCLVDGVLLFGAFENTLHNNSIKSNRGNGILLVNSCNNSIYGNTIRNSDYGIFLAYASNDNTLHHNNILYTNWDNIHFEDILGECLGNQWENGFSYEVSDLNDCTVVDPCALTGKKDGPTLSRVEDSVVCGNANGDPYGNVTIGDLLYIYEYLFNNGPAPDPLCSGNVNGMGCVTIGDYSYLYYHLFYEGPAPDPSCCSVCTQ